LDRDGKDLMIVEATEEEMQRHEIQLDLLDTAALDGALWRRSKS
jgi:hypothetical protein